MKKKLVTMLLATTMVASMFAGCGSDGGSKNSSDSGSVYMLNFKPETDQAWQDLAKEYSDEKGVDVTVVTAADGQYKTQLQSELAKKEAPTIFNIGSTSDCAEYADYIYDLKDSEIYKHQSDKSLSLEYDGKVAAVANCYECYGIIYNKAILENYCKNYPEFKDAGCDLTAGQGEIKGTYLDNYKRVWDMYTNTSAADKSTLDSGSFDAEAELGMEEAVFYQNGDWEYAAFAPDNEKGYTVKQEDLSMMPIYFGVDDANEGLAVGTENHWAVNAKADQKNIDATLDFLEWVITSDDGRKAITETMGLSAPFDTFTGDFASKNGFAAMAAKYVEDGKTSVAWSFNATPSVDSWRADVVAPLTEYTERDGSWDDVEKAFVDQWAYYWNLSNEK